MMNTIKPGDMIGICAPSQVIDWPSYVRDIETLNRRGFRVKLGENVQKDDWGYCASAEDRAADINALVADDEVKMILFGGGEGAVEVLPHIDYESIRRHPKLFTSYSDGTCILNAVHAQTGLVTHYGTTPGVFNDLRYYDWIQFESSFVEGRTEGLFISDSYWKSLRGGACEGTLIGGYTLLFALMLNNRYFRYDPDKQYLLFLEDHKRFSRVGAVATYIAFIEQSPFMKNVAGLVFGHYDDDVPDDLYRCLERFGARNNIPVVYTDDFGHGTKHAILPIGVKARLDADARTLTLLGE
ncbi:MAG: LD-carboxypeptidase [Oscillospiraceae bacterium]|nr:LD-carboxypeptidase [Oscillospiraceae bacterium]